MLMMRRSGGKVWIAKFRYKDEEEAGAFSTRERANLWLYHMMDAPRYWKNGELDMDLLIESDWDGTKVYELKLDLLNKTKR